MLYLNQDSIKKLKASWIDTIAVIRSAVEATASHDFAQPIKPYLRYRKQENRIIAMPAFIGGSFDIAGIKWIASFPSNLDKNIPRAHSITILNDSATGKPIAIINSGLISGIRTASVSGVMISQFDSLMKLKSYRIGISGFGPIGQLHAELIQELLKDKIETINVFDVRHVSNSERDSNSIHFVGSWQEAYDNADIFITCTTSTTRYINRLPKKGSLQLNISLRDYEPNILKQCAHIVVDDWNEVCRENTDIENAHKHFNLSQNDVCSLSEVVVNDYFSKIDKEKFSKDQFIIFNPMGMSIFDMAIAKYFYDRAKEFNIGLLLEE